MKTLKIMSAVCVQNIRALRTSRRFWAAAALLVIAVQLYTADIRAAADALGTEVPIWIFPFLFTGFSSGTVFMLPSVLLFGHAPADKRQTLTYIRAKRSRWLGGQILYIFVVSAAYCAFLAAVTVLSTVFYGGASADWGETLPAMAELRGLGFAEISGGVLTRYTPAQAMFGTFMLVWMCMVMMGLAALIFGMLSGKRPAGEAFCSVMILSGAVIRKFLPALMPFSPISWCSLDAAAEICAEQPLSYCVFIYAWLAAVLTACLFLFCGRRRFGFKAYINRISVRFFGY